MATAAVLISRQPMQPTANTAWVRAAGQAVRWLGQRGYTVLTSEGMQTFEMVLYWCVKYQVNQIIVLCASDMHHFIQRYLWVKSQFDCFICNSIIIPLINKSKKMLPSLRDRFIMENADLLLPVSIRNNGELAKLIESCEGKNHTVDRRFQIPYEHRLSKLKYSVKREEISEAVKSIKGEYVIHWTRSSSYAWPGERLQSYYASVSICNVYPRNAFLTLQNILSTKTIKASSRHMSRNVKVVSFTGHSPFYFSSLMKWRSRYKEMSFEPYGIGIDKKAAVKYGIRPVIYHKNCHNTDKERWLKQTYGRLSWWPDEDEYRHAGDLDLSLFFPEQLLCFCLMKKEAELIERKFGIRAVAFYG